METRTQPSEYADQAGVAPSLTCPGCSTDLTLAIREVDGVSLGCEACNERWHFELGFMRRAVPPSGRAG
jgi:hypothetical protein